MMSIKRVKIKDKPFLCRLIYADGKGSKLLKCDKHNLRGKPDMIYRNIITGRLIPIELKSGDADAPNLGDIMQLATYFLLIQSYYGARPKFGFLRYKNSMFKIKNTRQIRNDLLDTINDMRQMLNTGEGLANPSFVNCKYCIARATVCKFAE